ncbi:MAG: DNA polymerase I, partial [Lachnospiraceae bacterium]|nr:DNA polymerase I [Lachnospiraceae bacterium]
MVDIVGMSEKIVLIDGNSIMNRAFFGLPMLTNGKGLHTNAVYGFLNILLKILDEESPEYLAVAFDLHAPTFRHKLYADYKGTRKGMPEELREQMPVIKELLKAMRLCIVEKEGYEADDILGTIAKRSEKEGLAVSLVSGGRDLLQIATDKIKIRIPKTKGGRTEIEDYYTKDVIDKYGLEPYQIIELKVLMGDSSDNIPGVPKIGEKTATALLMEYGDIENLKLHREEITKKSIREALMEHFDMAELSKTLATIDIQAPVEVALADMRLKDMFTKEAYELVKELGFKNILPRFQTADIPDELELSCEVADTKEKLSELVEKLKKSEDFGFQLFFGEGFIGFSFCTEKERACFVPALRMGIDGISEDFLRDSVLSLFEEKKETKEGGSFSTFSVKELFHYLPELADFDGIGRFFDVKLASYLLNPLKSDYSIEDAAAENGIVMQSYQELFGKASLEQAVMGGFANFVKYACHCAYVSFMSHKPLYNRLQANGMERLFTEIEMPLTICLYGMEKEGIRVLPAALKEYGDELGKQIVVLEEKIHKEADSNFNINSPKQLGEILFDKMKLPGAKKTKTGYSTSADILEKLSVDVPFVRDILKIRIRGADPTGRGNRLMEGRMDP